MAGRPRWGLRPVIEHALALLAARENRKRQLMDRAASNRREIVECIVANLALSGGVPVAVQMAHKRRGFERQGFNALPKIIGKMDEAGLLVLTVSRQRGRSTIIASPSLTQAILNIGDDG
jgi:hypothetical protein